MATPVRVVVVGGQFAGRRVAALLSRPGFAVTVIDAKGYFEYTPSVLRALVEPGTCGDMLVPHPPEVMVGSVVEVQVAGHQGQPGYVRLSDGRQVAYDYLVVATGSTYAAPIKAQLPTANSTTEPAQQEGTSGSSNDRDGLPNGGGARPGYRDPRASSASSLAHRRRHLLLAAAELQLACSVVVVGGGTVGVELAAEVAGRYGRSKRVTLITSRQRLLDRMPVSASNYAHKWLTQHGVEVITGEKCYEDSTVGATEGDAAAGRPTLTIRTTTGRTLHANIVYQCTGGAACGSLYEGIVALQSPAASVGAQPPAGHPLEASLASDGGGALTASGAAETQARPPKSSPGAGIPVTNTLQLPCHPTIFACGDCIVTRFEKTAFLADLSASVVAGNIRKLAAAAATAKRRAPGADGKAVAATVASPMRPLTAGDGGDGLREAAVDASRLGTFPEASCYGAAVPPTIAAVSLYKYCGIMQVNDLVLTGVLPAAAKAIIEFFQVQGARAQWLQVPWRAMESLTVLLGTTLLAPRRASAPVHVDSASAVLGQGRVAV